MKELYTFRKFLAEGEAKGFIFWFRKGKRGEEQLKKAKEILDGEGISFTSAGEMALGFPAFADEKNIKSILQNNGVTRYVIANNMEEDLAENEDRGEFGQESLDKLYDTVEAMGRGPAQQKAMDMMEDGAFFPEEGTSPAVNQTQEAVEELNYVKNSTDDEEEIEEAKLFLDAIIIIKNAVKKIGPVSYGEMGQSYNYYVEGDDLFTQTRETFEVPTNEGEEVNEQELDIENPGNPLYDLNNDEEAVKYLNDLMDKYGETVVQLWITSGEYPQDY
jgi:hypothetical protein